MNKDPFVEKHLNRIKIIQALNGNKRLFVECFASDEGARFFPNSNLSVKEIFVESLPEGGEAKYEYEVYIWSEPGDLIQINSWLPIATDYIKHPERIDDYIKRGLLRKVNTEQKVQWSDTTGLNSSTSAGNQKSSSVEEIFEFEAKKGMIQFNIKNFKRDFPHLYKVIISAMMKVKNT